MGTKGKPWGNSTVFDQDIMAWVIDQAGDCRMDLLDDFITRMKGGLRLSMTVQNRIYFKRYSIWAHEAKIQPTHWHNYSYYRHPENTLGGIPNRL